MQEKNEREVTESMGGAEARQGMERWNGEVVVLRGENGGTRHLPPN